MLKAPLRGGCFPRSGMLCRLHCRPVLVAWPAGRAAADRFGGARATHARPPPALLPRVQEAGANARLKLYKGKTHTKPIVEDPSEDCFFTSQPACACLCQALPACMACAQQAGGGAPERAVASWWHGRRLSVLAHAQGGQLGGRGPGRRSCCLWPLSGPPAVTAGPWCWPHPCLQCGAGGTSSWMTCCPW